MDRVIAEQALPRGVPEERVRADLLGPTSMRTFIDANDVAELALILLFALPTSCCL